MLNPLRICPEEYFYERENNKLKPNEGWNDDESKSDQSRCYSCYLDQAISFIHAVAALLLVIDRSKVMVEFEAAADSILVPILAISVGVLNVFIKKWQR